MKNLIPLSITLLFLPFLLHAQTFKVCDVSPAKDTLETQALITYLNANYVEAVRKQEEYKILEQAWRARADSMDAIAARYKHNKKKRNKAIAALPIPPDSLDLGPLPFIEASSPDRRPIVPARNNAFYEAAALAYAQHRPLALSPDDVWLAICQGFAQHVAQNSEALRQHFVPFEGKKVLNIKLDRWPEADSGEWEAMFVEFNRQIAAYTGEELSQTVNASFSTTTPDAKIAFSISMMSAMQQYFDYWGTVLCGIPEITLKGSPEDWEALEARTAQLAQYQLDWWVSELKPILQEFTKASKGEVNLDFWQKIVKYEEKDLVCSTTPVLTGWINTFFPYVFQGGKMVRNPLLGIRDFSVFYAVKKGYDGKEYKVYAGPEIEPNELPAAVVSAPVNMNNNGSLHKLEAYAGFLGVRQDPKTLALSPAIGWFVINTRQKPDQEAISRYDQYLKEQAAKKPTANKNGN